VAVFPIFFMLITSLKTPLQTYDPSIWWFRPTFENYRSLFRTYDAAPHLLNSVVVTTGSVLLALGIGAIAGYGLSAYRFRGKDAVANWMLSVRFVPAMASIIPLFLLANTLKVIDTYAVLVITYLTFNVPFATWMLRGFFEAIPHEIEEAARIDGASHWHVLWKVVAPLAAPGFFATAALLVIQTWNEFMLALFLTTDQARTMPTITSQFQTVRGVIWGEMTALGVLTTLPVFVFAILARRYLVRGLTFGALK
jgi:multiple sugar transport system permease protein